MKLSTLPEVVPALDEAEVRPVRIVRLPTPLSLKDEAGRPQDVADAAELRHLHKPQP